MRDVNEIHAMRLLDPLNKFIIKLKLKFFYYFINEGNRILQGQAPPTDRLYRLRGEGDA